MIEKEIVERVEELDKVLTDTRQRVSSLKKQLMDNETIVITCNIEKNRLLEELRIYRKEHYSKELTDRDKDIARFKALIPELMKKI